MSAVWRAIFIQLAVLLAVRETPQVVKASSNIIAGLPENRNVAGTYCVRLYTRSGSVGCYGSSKGINAPLVAIKSNDELSTFLSSGNERSVVLLSNMLFNLETLRKLETSGKAEGVLLLNDTMPPAFSAAGATPQGRNTPDSGLNPYPDYEWNPRGLNMLTESIGFPVLRVSDSQINALLSKAAVNNMPRPFKWSATMDYYFGPKNMDSVSCLTMKDIFNTITPMCDPIGGHSAYAIKGNPGNPIIAAVAAVDANAFTHDGARGANAGASGIVALLGAADAIAKVDMQNLNKSIAFFGFQAESFGFTGSRRFLKDLQLFQQADACKNLVPGADNPTTGEPLCANPLKHSLHFASLALSNFESIIAVDQVAFSDNGKFYIHDNPNSARKLATIVSTVPAAGSRVFAATSASLPPTPFSSFVQINSSITGSVFAGYNEKYTNMFYNSEVDNAWDTEALANATTVLAQSLLRLAGASDTTLSGVNANATLLNEMMRCFTIDQGCALFRTVTKQHVSFFNEKNNLKNDSIPTYYKTPTLYPGIFSAKFRQPVVATGNGKTSKLVGAWKKEEYNVQYYPQMTEAFVRSFLASVTSLVPQAALACNLTTDCQQTNATWECIHPGICAARSAYFHDALSPGLEPLAVPGTFEVLGGYSEDPLWTEPLWGNLGTLVWPDGGHVVGWSTLGAGIAVSGMSLAISMQLFRSLGKHKML